MNYFQNAVLISFLCISLNVFGEKISGSCQENYDNREWKKAEVSCELQFNKDRSTQRPLLLLNYLAQISAKLDIRDNEEFYLYLMKGHPEFSSDLVHQYMWHQKMGQIAFYKFNYDAALENFRKKFDIAVQLNDQELQSESYNDLGDLYKNTGDYLKALKNYQNSLTLNLMLNEVGIAADSYNNIGSLLLKLEKPEEPN